MTDHPTILVTGATDGLGRALSHRLAERGCRVLLHGRDRDKLDRARAELEEKWPSAPPPATLCADLSVDGEVRALADTVLRTTDRLDVLVNNAGIAYTDDVREFTAAGHELRFAVNFLAPFQLTLRVLPLLRSTGRARVVNVASAAQRPVDFADVMMDRDYSGARAHAQSKFAVIAAGFALSRRLDPDLVTVNSLHPATLMPTKPVLARFGSSVDALETGVESVSALATDPAHAGRTGRYFDRAVEARAHELAHDHHVQERLWDTALDLTGVPVPDLPHPVRARRRPSGDAAATIPGPRRSPR